MCYCFYYRTFFLGQTIQTFVHFTALRLSIMRVTAACSQQHVSSSDLPGPGSGCWGRHVSCHRDPAPCLLSVCPSVNPRHQVTHSEQTESTTWGLQPVQCCSAAGPDIAPSFVWLARPRPHRGLEGQGWTSISFPPIVIVNSIEKFNFCSRNQSVKNMWQEDKYPLYVCESGTPVQWL